MQTDIRHLVETIISEGAIGMAHAGRLIGEALDGRVVSPPTMIRLWRRGTKLPDGRIVKLEAIRWAGKILTSRQAVIRFIAAQNEPEAEEEPVPQSPRDRSRAAAAAERELDALGVC